MATALEAPCRPCRPQVPPALVRGAAVGVPTCRRAIRNIASCTSGISGVTSHPASRGHLFELPFPREPGCPSICAAHSRIRLYVPARIISLAVRAGSTRALRFTATPLVGGRAARSRHGSLLTCRYRASERDAGAGEGISGPSLPPSLGGGGLTARRCAALRAPSPPIRSGACGGDETAKKEKPRRSSHVLLLRLLLLLARGPGRGPAAPRRAAQEGRKARHSATVTAGRAGPRGAGWRGGARGTAGPPAGRPCFAASRPRHAPPRAAGGGSRANHPPPTAPWLTGPGARTRGGPRARARARARAWARVRPWIQTNARSGPGRVWLVPGARGGLTVPMTMPVGGWARPSTARPGYCRPAGAGPNCAPRWDHGFG
eukprot:scaffold1306_cov399-Prasinococcus_capsulatus_cf.AAC.11